MAWLFAFAERSRRFESLNIDEKESFRFVQIGNVNFPRVQITIVVDLRRIFFGTFQMFGIFFF